jgi:hypothetical protein
MRKSIHVAIERIELTGVQYKTFRECLREQAIRQVDVGAIEHWKISSECRWQNHSRRTVDRFSKTMLGSKFQKRSLLPDELTEVEIRYVVAMAGVSEISLRTSSGIPKIELREVVLEGKSVLFPILSHRTKAWKQKAPRVGRSAERVATSPCGIA